MGSEMCIRDRSMVGGRSGGGDGMDVEEEELEHGGVAAATVTGSRRKTTGWTGKAGSAATDIE